MINNATPNQQMMSTPPPTPPMRRRTLWIWLIGLVVVVVAIVAFLALQLFGVSASSPSSPSAGSVQSSPSSPSAGGVQQEGMPPVALPGPPVANPGGVGISAQQAVATVKQYYTYINARDYQDAYSLWGRSYQNSTSLPTFAQGFANTQNDTIQLGNVVMLSDGTVKVPITVLASIPFGGSTTVNTYQGYYIVGQEDSRIKLLSANIQITGSSNDRAQHAVATVNQYYADISAKNYQAAYNLWGTAYHQSTSYQQFVAGFAHTKSVSITLLYGIEVLKEGSVEVPLTIHSVDTTNSGVVTHTYQGYYIVGTEGADWQLFSANIQ